MSDINDKPIMKKEISIRLVLKEEKYIFGSGSADSLEDISSFGELTTFRGGRFILSVDPRYGFQDVVDYIDGYGR